MDEIEAVLGIAMTLKERGEPLPLDLLARTDALGIDVAHLDQPKPHNTDDND